MRWSFSCSLFCIAVIFCSCWEEDQPQTRAENFFLQVEVRGEEGKEDVTVTAQLHKAGPTGSTRKLEADESIALDGRPLQGDSAGFSGFVYETAVPVRAFTGRHELSFALGTESQSLPFEYSPARFKSEREQFSKGKDLALELESIPADLTDIRLSLVDTSFRSEDIQELVTPSEGVITIPAAQLNSLSPGPVSLELIFEKRTKIEAGGRFAGILRAVYSLRRDLVLLPGK